MKLPHLALLSALLLAHVPGWSNQSAQPKTPASTTRQRVDALFAQWNKPDAPGVAVEVVKDGKVIYRRAFGMADLEHGAPITPSTTFHVASLSKQFTAFATLLLAQDGKLSLDDDIRTYLPDLPDFGQTIRIRHLLNHTSGLRDQWNLLAMAGWRMDDVITDDDVLRLVRRQRALNFAPGSEFAYCNTGFTLLAMIVQRVTGKSLAQFARERIFQPLGMTHTFFHEQYGTLVPGRAQSYQPAPGGGYEGFALSYSTTGPTSLFTSADDLVLWDRNFDDARVGGKELLAQMLRPAVLNDGEPIAYAAGVGVGTYRGLKTVSHNGVDAGYRSYLLRFPDQHLTIVIVANGADVLATRLGQGIADIYLDGLLEARASPVPNDANLRQVPIHPSQLDALVGAYHLAGTDSAVTFVKENGHLMGWETDDDKQAFFPASERQFFIKIANASFTFDPPGEDGVVASGTWQHNGRTMRATRIRSDSGPAGKLKAYEGEYYSDELHVLYTVTARDGKLVLSYSRGDIELDPVGTGSFVGPWPFGHIHYQCTAQAGCTGLTVSDGRVRDLKFAKVTLAAAGAGTGGAPSVVASAATPSGTVAAASPATP